MIRPDQTRPDHYSAIYSDEFYKAHHSDSLISAADKIVAAIKGFMSFDSVIDIGCGAGLILGACLKSGVKVVRGVDGSWVNKSLLLIPQECFTNHDLSKPMLIDKIVEKHFDLTISSEVAEHLDAQDTEVFMNNLVSFSDVILFSAAIPEQGGTHHVNEQWPSYWIEKFAARGYVPVDCIRPLIWDDSSIPFWYRQNFIVFVKKDALPKYPALDRESKRPVLDVVHPQLWRRNSDVRNMGFVALFKLIIKGMIYIIPAFFKAIKRRFM